MSIPTAFKNQDSKQTQGHLLLIRGIREALVLVNDPTSDEVQNVYWEYVMEEFENVWFRRKGIGYVIFPPE